MTTNSFKPFIDYPVRPKIEVGESLSGYIYRFFSANGHTVSQEVNAVLNGFSSKKLERIMRSHTLLKSMIGTRYEKELTDRLEEWWIVKSQYYAYDAGSGYATRVRLCPYCLEDNPIHYAFWAFPLVVACPEHGCLLITVCDQCTKPLYWISLAPGWCCKCGASLQKTIAKNAIPRLVTLAKLVVSARDMVVPERLKIRWSDSTILNRYDLEELSYLLEGSYRFILKDAYPYLPQKFLSQFEHH